MRGGEGVGEVFSPSNNCGGFYSMPDILAWRGVGGEGRRYIEGYEKAENTAKCLFLPFA